MKATKFATASFVTAAIAALVLTFAPLGTRCVSNAESHSERCEAITLFTMDGSWIVVVVAIPVAIAAVPLLVRRKAARRMSAILLWVCCVVGLASVGLYLIPSAILMTVAATHREEERAARTGMMIPGGRR